MFRSFSETTPGEFRFNWLWDLPFRASFDPKRGALSFNKLLPKITPRSELESQLKTFIESCCSPDRPEHRRLDAGRLTVRYTNRGSAASLTFLSRDDDYEYAVKQSINLLNEIFLSFLNVRYPEYMVENFRLSEE